MSAADHDDRTRRLAETHAERQQANNYLAKLLRRGATPAELQQARDRVSRARNEYRDARRGGPHR
jgi:hypothetical protein